MTGVSGKIAEIMERLRYDYLGNLAGRLRNFRVAKQLGEHCVDRVPDAPATGIGQLKRLVDRSRSAAEKAKNSV